MQKYEEHVLHAEEKESVQITHSSFSLLLHLSSALWAINRFRLVTVHLKNQMVNHFFLSLIVMAYKIY